MEDGLVLARMLAESPRDIALTLRRYEAIRSRAPPASN
jgi:hypothetical protein